MTAAERRWQSSGQSAATEGPRYPELRTINSKRQLQVPWRPRGPILKLDFLIRDWSSTWTVALGGSWRVSSRQWARESLPEAETVGGGCKEPEVGGGTGRAAGPLRNWEGCHGSKSHASPHTNASELELQPPDIDKAIRLCLELLEQHTSSFQKSDEISHKPTSVKTPAWASGPWLVEQRELPLM